MDKYLYGAASDYLDSAFNFTHAVEVLMRANIEKTKDDRARFDDINHHLLGQAAELVLKAGLLCKKVAFSDLKKLEIAHDLSALMDKSKALDIDINQSFELYAKSVSKNYKEHDFRYSRCFWGVDDKDVDLHEYICTGKVNGKWPSEQEEMLLRKREKDTGLCVKSIIPFDKFVSAIQNQIKIIDQNLKQKESNAQNK